MVRSDSVAASHTTDEIARHRRQLQAVLSSKAFASSKQLSEFLRFVAEKALSGAEHLSQEEIAEHILAKGKQFDASYDSLVRKLASMTRQRLARYYVEEGVRDDVELILPLRSYLPVFRVREPMEAAPLEKNQVRQRWPWAATMAIVLTAGIGVAGFYSIRKPALEAEPLAYSFQTGRGDIAYAGADALPSSVLLGGPLEDGLALTARLSFQPEHEAQQAGIILWQDADNFVRLGRSFTGRNYLEFAAERAGAVQTASENLQFDPEGQSGKDVWLSVQRSGSHYRAFVSSDGSDWTAFGIPIDAPRIPHPRIGLYAYHGRREAPPALAKFEHVSRELSFAEGNVDRLTPKLQASCDKELAINARAPVLSLRLLDAKPACSVMLRALPLPAGDWSVESRIDSIVAPGAMAGAYVAGSKGRVRLIRYGTDQPSISLMHDVQSVQTLPDFTGAPPLTLRFSKSGDKIYGSSSRDGREFRSFSNGIAVAQLGSDLHAGLILAISGKGRPHFPPSMSVYYWRSPVEPLRPWR